MTLAKNFVAVTLLVFTFALTSFGGDLQTPGIVPPPPPPPRMRTLEPEKSEIAIDVAGAPGEAQETFDSFWYQALLGLLSIY